MAGDVKVAVVSGQLPASDTGTVDLIKSGFGTPKACIVILTDDANDNASTDTQSRASIGLSDFINDYCIAHQDENASAKVDCDSIKSNTSCYINMNISGGITHQGTASAIADGVRLTNIAGAALVFVTVIMFGGADLAVSLQRSTIASSQNNTATISHSDFTDGNDKLIFFIGCDISGEDSASSGINCSFGVCHATGSDGGGWTFSQRCLGWSSDHNASSADANTIICNNRALSILTEPGVQDWALEVTGYSSSGGTITVTTRDNGAGAGMEVYSLALDLDDRKAKVASVNSPTSGSTWAVTGTGFKPQYVGFILTRVNVENTSVAVGINGIASNTGSGEETCHSWYNQDGADPTNTKNLFRSRILDLRDEPISGVVQDHNHLSFDSNGFTTTINIENETVGRKFGYWAIEEVVAGATVIGIASETDTALAIGKAKAKAFGIASETDTALAMVAARTRSIALGIASETDTALAIEITKALILGIAIETDTVLSIIANRLYALGVAVETDTALSLSILIRRYIALGVATETDTALGMSLDRAYALGIATETDVALSLVAPQLIALGIALETDTALPISILRAFVLGIASTIDTARSIGHSKGLNLGIASEVDTALVIIASRAYALGIATETDIALTINVLASQITGIGIASETDTAFAMSILRTIATGLSTSTSIALPMTIRRGYNVGLPIETDTALSMSIGKALLLGIATEVDTALAIAISGGSGGTPSVPRGRSVRMITPTRLTNVEKPQT